MYLKSVAWKLDVWKDFVITQIDPFSVNDQDFVNELKWDLLLTLSGSPSWLIEKYAWKYFIWYEDIDKEIFDAIVTLSSWMWIDNISEKALDYNEIEPNDKLKKLLFILKKVIIKDFFFHWLSLCNTSKDRLKSVLLRAADKYSIQELETIFSFDNITFDVLDNLNWLDNIEITEIIEILKTKVQTKFFPTCLTKENIKNIVPNILFLEDRWSDKLEFIKGDYVLNTCHLKNWKWCMTDLLLLSNDIFQLIEPQLEEIDYNMMSFVFSGYEFYKNFFDRVWKKNLSNAEIKKELKIISRKICWEWVFFWVDKWLPIEMLTIPRILCDMTYKQCSYVYENITKDPNELIELFSKDYDTLIFIYNNITKNISEILDIYYCIRGNKQEDIKVIYDEIGDYEKFKIIMHRFDHDEITWDEFSVLAFFCKHFKEDVLDWVDNNINSKIYKLTFTRSANIEFFYEKWLCTSLDDFIAVRDSKILLANINLIKFYYEKWICKTMEDFLTMMDNWLIYVNQPKIELLYYGWLCSNIDDFLEYKQIISLDIELLKKISNLYSNNDYDKWFNLFKEVCDSSYSTEDKENIVSKIIELPLSVAEKYVKACDAFDKSNSFDIQVVKDALIMDILDAENPEEIVKEVDRIFLESNLPIVSKIFQVFKYVYNEDEMENKLTENSSPCLTSCKTYEKKLEVIYMDLMNIMIKSWESSLKEFIQDIISSKQALLDFENWKILDNKWNGQVLSLMKKIISLKTIINTNWVNNIEILKHDWEIDAETLKIYYNNLRKTLLVKNNDSIYTFFLNLCKKIWYNSLEDIIFDINRMQIQANDNWLNLINSMKYWEIFNSSDNYFLKWISAESFWEILNRWVTSTEYLWWWEWSDVKISSNWTPFDTDGVIIRWENVFNTAKSHWYWNIAIIISVDKPWFYNTDIWLQWYNSNIYEMFKNHWENSDYYWIRTWVASTEFDAIIYKPKEIDLWKLQEIKYLIARNGFYLPIFDLDKNLLFTPEEYNELRQGLSFSDKYKWRNVENRDWSYVSSNQHDLINQSEETFNTFIEQQKKQEIINEKINNDKLAKEVFDKIKDVLESELWIQCNQSKNLLWAELYDSGSTWRWTEIPSNDIDLDFTLLLNSQDYERLEEIQKIIHEKIWTIESTDHSTVDWNGLQIKSVKNGLWIEYWYTDWIHFDLLILKKTKSYLYPSNVAMQDRLLKVEELYWKDTLDFVKQNIVIMKKLLKSQWVYKNTEWWMWWIGVENWIMQHHWNFIEALESFEKVAYGWKYEEWKPNISFEEFKNFYFMRDSWQNFKDWKNDNYVLKMNETWYNRILNIIKKYRLEWLQWIEELLQNYREVKAEYLK